MTIFEQSQKGQRAYSLPKSHKEFTKYFPASNLLRESRPALPEISELDLTRHFCRLSRKNMGIDTHFYPLGSCTMKLNPRVNEVCATMPSFIRTHPLASDATVQGNLQIAYELIELLCEISGMKAGSILPNAGAQGEFVGISMIKAFHKKHGDEGRNQMLIPDSAHGTNPATAKMAGFEIISVPTDDQGDIDLEALRGLINERKTAGLMLTNPNTLGLFSSNILQVARVVHDAGGLLFYDGANLNPILNIVRPGDMGFDVIHINLHKTFSTPHGGGGPGAGPVLCNEKLEEFLPLPRIEKKDNFYSSRYLDKESIGRIVSFYGNFGVCLRAYLYIRLHGNYGLRRIAENAVVNANYLKKRLAHLFTIPYSKFCMHEFVLQVDSYLDQGVRALDIAKRLLDYGVHAPTIYFPLIIKECMLIEPTESESKATLDHFVNILEKIIEEVHQNSDLVKMAPHSLSVKRLDEVRAAKVPILKTETRI